jgi:hypothetical protein
LIDESVKIPAMPALAPGLDPAALPRWQGGRPLKRWRYVGVYGPELMCCFGVVSIAGLPQSFWAVWDRTAGRLHERTRLRSGAVRLTEGGIAIDLAFDERGAEPVEVVSAHGASEIWTRKRAGMAFNGSVVLDGAERPLNAHGIVDDSAGYHARHTVWSWCAGVGVAQGGAGVAWNLVTGVHDGPTGSERAVWVDGAVTEAPPVRFDEALTSVAAVDGSFALACHAEAVRQRNDNLLIMRSRYRQPFGTFTGSLPGGIVLADGYGVMEHHDAYW